MPVEIVTGANSYDAKIIIETGSSVQHVELAGGTAYMVLNDHGVTVAYFSPRANVVWYQVAAAPELYEFKLESVGLNKIPVIKALRSYFSLGLKEAKSLTDVAPIVVASDVKGDLAARAKKDLEEIGATVIIRLKTLNGAAVEAE